LSKDVKIASSLHSFRAALRPSDFFSYLPSLCNVVHVCKFSGCLYDQKFDISELVAKRMDAQRRLQSDPNDVDALLTLQEIQMKMQNWCQSNVKPGQFTGELVKNLLPKEQLQGGFQAWAKKVFFGCSCFERLCPSVGSS